MKLKQNVRFGKSEIAITVAIMVVNSIFEKHGQEFTITSFNDSQHGSGSFHYKDRAFDVRTKDIATESLKQTIFNEIKQSLPFGFDILFEGQGTVNSHFHLEWDPK